MMRRLLSTTLAITTGCLLATGAVAQSDEDQIDYRQAVFTLVGANFGPMGDMAQGEIDYDAEQFARNAARVADLSRMAKEGFEGGPHDGDTDAKPAIWDEWDRFSEGMTHFESAAQELAEATEGGDRELADVQDRFMQVAESCQSCHDNYRDN
ncbi:MULTISPECIES: c-type cytochrome [unclassified Halorhodospira]|uniref:c-type cytochrome n=1 Tax=unclassified Halorhodospira TaxID=2626748 RepID=UPI001EE7D5D7|nr:MULTISPECIES: cytochrome c [unclassified Halorhodospira]MCG5541602.1 cytochrome c [Halorhodospira sp. M39old]MCG5544665.1 cytochrome c [Halorhodospira sp. M38]